MRKEVSIAVHAVNQQGRVGISFHSLPNFALDGGSGLIPVPAGLRPGLRTPVRIEQKGSGIQDQSGGFGEETSLLLMLGLETQILLSTFLILVAVLTELLCSY